MEWEGVRHPFHPNTIWSSSLLWPMYPFMHDMNNMLHIWTKLNHISLFMNASSSLLKIQIYVVIKLDFGLEKWDMFLCVEKIVFGIEKSNMCLLNKTKSFGFFF